MNWYRMIWRNFQMPLLTLAGIVFYLVFWQKQWEITATIIALFTIALGSWPMLAETIESIRQRQFALDYIAILALLVSVLTQEYLAGTVIALMLSTGRTLEAYGMKRAKQSLTQLVDRIPRTVTLFTDSEIGKTVALSQVSVGEMIFIRRGEVIALDGKLVSEQALTDDSSLTGEPYFLEKTTGDQMRSGTVNIGNPIVIQVTKRAGDSTYEKIIAMVQAAANEKPLLVRLADRYSTWFTVVTFCIAGIAYFISHDILRVLAVLVVATPCPLILATPIALLGGMNALAKYNIIIKKIASLEVLDRITTVIFDKTGTITLGRPTVIGVELFNHALSTEQLISIAAAIERNSLHPVAKAIVSYAQQQQVPVVHASEVHEEIGQGIIGTVNATTYRLSKWTIHDGLSIGIWKNNQVQAVIHLSDEMKSGSKDVIRQLRELTLELQIFTGDKQSNAQRILAQLDQSIIVKADCSPEDKQQGIQQLKQAGKIIAMVGDGINDAPALALADVGIVFSNEQQTAASEAADIVILNSEFELITKLLFIARRTIRIAKQSIGWGIGLSIVAMLFAAAGWIPPIVGALLQEAIDLVVIINALRTSRL